MSSFPHASSDPTAATPWPMMCAINCRITTQPFGGIADDADVVYDDDDVVEIFPDRQGQAVL